MTQPQSTSTPPRSLRIQHVSESFPGYLFPGWCVTAKLASDPHSASFPIAVGNLSDMEVLQQALILKNDGYIYALERVVTCDQNPAPHIILESAA